MRAKLLIPLFIFVLLAHASDLSFMDSARERTRDLMSEIYKNPFLEELVGGTLPENKWDYYYTQDLIYLTHFDNALMLLTTKTSDDNMASFFVKQAKIYVSHEKQLDQVVPCPSCKEYAVFETQSVGRSLEYGLAALVPCYVVYDEVGIWLRNQLTQNNPYKQEIQKIFGEKPSESARTIEKYINMVAERESEETRQEMLEIYYRSVKYELEFWDSAYKLAPEPERQEL